jgi:hypothetical protein
MGLMIPQAGDTFELFETATDFSGHGIIRN